MFVGIAIASIGLSCIALGCIITKGVKNLEEELDMAYNAMADRDAIIVDKEEKAIISAMEYTKLKNDTDKTFISLKEKYDLVQVKSIHLMHDLEQLEKSHKKLEADLYNLDWAYSELMKCYNSNAMDLYFWNLLPKSDREIRRKFIQSGKYKVYNLATGELCFEVI
ncbi:MAG: hypothetical protein ACRCYT_01965 [Cetobacterium sp.]